MTITWYGHSCIKIETASHNEDVVIFIDPFDLPVKTLRTPRAIAADAVLLTRAQSTPPLQGRGGGVPAVFSSPGEYEFKDVFVRAIPIAGAGGMHIFWIEVEDVALAHLGALSRVLSETELQEIYKLDLLFLPVGGQDVLDAKGAAQVISELEPRMVIPMCYRPAEIKDRYDTVEPFLKAVDAEVERAPRLKLTRKELPHEEMKVVVLDRA